MNKFLKIISLILVSSLWLVSCAAGSVNQSVTGFIQSTGVDDDDNPIDVYIFDGKTEYKIAKNKQHSELLNLVDHKVSASGEVSDAGEGKKLIAVDKYKILD